MPRRMNGTKHQTGRNGGARDEETRQSKAAPAQLLTRREEEHHPHRRQNGEYRRDPRGGEHSCYACETRSEQVFRKGKAKDDEIPAETDAPFSEPPQQRPDFMLSGLETGNDDGGQRGCKGPKDRHPEVEPVHEPQPDAGPKEREGEDKVEQERVGPQNIGHVRLRLAPRVSVQHRPKVRSATQMKMARVARPPTRYRASSASVIE